MIEKFNILISCVQGMYNNIVLYHKTALLIASVEMFPITFMLIYLAGVLMKQIIKAWDKTLERCVRDLKFRNRIASIIYFIGDMGPDISSVAVIALFITSSENGLLLTVVFFAGIIIKEMSREFKNIFYSEIEKRSS